MPARTPEAYAIAAVIAEQEAEREASEPAPYIDYAPLIADAQARHDSVDEIAYLVAQANQKVMPDA